ncbi:MAG: hypothetical protein A2289_13910 [Deltaproteobacteria bacterium RIFOXYA12_FULL_58_15]|nr:MAG: hypothetical protein A2289_13910 [Deltaproteobacteria bacterium RIFOXYA12_FULL_58_15]OGR09596.1 MAG: hypothetical protein A2341_16490 [Deltaproteobacteria bacterium RIFOXYB12_FULL_58_9]
MAKPHLHVQQNPLTTRQQLQTLSFARRRLFLDRRFAVITRDIATLWPRRNRRVSLWDLDGSILHHSISGLPEEPNDFDGTKPALRLP